jgi:hypothetical protein
MFNVFLHLYVAAPVPASFISGNSIEDNRVLQCKNMDPASRTLIADAFFILSPLLSHPC